MSHTIQDRDILHCIDAIGFLFVTRSISLTKSLIKYINQHNPPEHESMRICRKETKYKYPNDYWFQVSQEQMSFMQMIVSITGAVRILEIGTFNGYSAMGFALSALKNCKENARVVTIENNLLWSGNARGYFTKAGLSDYIHLIEKDATEALSELSKGSENHFDLCFIDADKKNTYHYIDRCASLVRIGGIVLIDNILWGGKVINPDEEDDDTIALIECAEKAIIDERFDQMICSIGDGLLFLLRK